MISFSHVLRCVENDVNYTDNERQTRLRLWRAILFNHNQKWPQWWVINRGNTAKRWYSGLTGTVTEEGHIRTTEYR